MSPIPIIARTAVLLTLALFAGCASTASKQGKDALLPEIDVVQVKESSDEALRLAQEAKLDVEMVNTKLTEMDNKVLLLTEDVSTVSIAKIEELENRIALIVEALKDLQTQLDALKTDQAPLAGQKNVALSGGGKPGAPPPRPATFSITSPEYSSYQTALSTYNARNFKKALELFEEVLKQYPQGKYADNCAYWVGECYYAQSDYPQAVAAFQKVADYPNSSKADDAQFKVGKSNLAMGQAAQAKIEWNKLLSKFPGSEYAPRVKQYLAEIK